MLFQILQFNIKKNFKLVFYKKLINMYKQFLFNNNKKLLNYFYNKGLYITHPKRQLILTFFNNKIYTKSTGVILKTNNINLKYFKRTTQCNAALVIYIENFLLKESKLLYYIGLKNFSKKSLLFLQKLWIILNPSVFLFNHKYSYNHIKTPQKRIKRKIYKLLLKK